MLCLKILHRHWICSIFVFSFFLFFSVFGLSHDSFATSYSCSPSNINNINPVSDCPNFPYSSSNTSATTFYYYDLAFSYSNSTFGQNLFLNFSGANYRSTATIFISRYSGSSPLLYSNSNVFFVAPYVHFDSSTDFRSYVYTFYFNVPSGGTVSDVSFKITDDINDLVSSSPSEPCPVCPEIPENPYDNKLDDIKKAIYCCGAVLIMLYFFFCIYKIIVKDGGSR